MLQQNPWSVLENRIAFVQQLRNKLLAGKKKKINPISKVYRHVIDVLVELTLYSSQLNVDSRPTKLHRMEKLTKPELHSIALQITYFQKLILAFDSAHKLFNEFNDNQCKKLQICLGELSQITIDEKQLKIYDQQIQGVITELQILAMIPQQQVMAVYEQNLPPLTSAKIVNQLENLRKALELLRTLSSTSLQQVLTIGCWQNHFQKAKGFKPSIQMNNKGSKRAKYVNIAIPRKKIINQRSQSFRSFQQPAERLMSLNKLGPIWEKATSRTYCPLAITALLPTKLVRMNWLRGKLQSSIRNVKKQPDLHDTKITFVLDLCVTGFIAICNIIRIQLLLWFLSMKRCPKVTHFTIAYQLKLLQISSPIFKLGFEYHYINLNMGFASRVYYRGIASYMIDVDRGKFNLVTKKYTQYLQKYHGKDLQQVGKMLKQQGVQGTDFQSQVNKINQKGFQLKQTLQKFNQELEKVMEKMPQAKKQQEKQKQQMQLQLKENMQKVNQKLAEIPSNSVQSLIDPQLPINQVIGQGQLGSSILVINQNIADVIQTQTQYVFDAAVAYQIPVTGIRQQINEGIKIQQKNKKQNQNLIPREEIIQVPDSNYMIEQQDKLQYGQDMSQYLKKMKRQQVLEKTFQGSNRKPSLSPKQRRQIIQQRKLGINFPVSVFIPRQQKQKADTGTGMEVNRMAVSSPVNISIGPQQNRNSTRIQAGQEMEIVDEVDESEAQKQIVQYHNRYQQSAKKENVQDEQIAQGSVAPTFVTNYTTEVVLVTNENIFNVTTVEEVFDPEKRGFDSMIDPLFDVLVEQSMQMKSKFDQIKAQIRYLTDSVDALKKESLKKSDEIITILNKMQKKIKKRTLSNTLLHQQAIMILRKNSASIIQQISQNGTRVVNQIVEQIQKIASIQLQNKKLLLENQQQGQEILKLVRQGFENGQKMAVQSWGYQHQQLTQDFRGFLQQLDSGRANMQQNLSRLIQSYAQAQGQQKQVFKQYLEGFMTQINAIKLLVSRTKGLQQLTSYINQVNQSVSQSSNEIKAYIQNLGLYEQRLAGQIQINKLQSDQQFKYLANGIRDGIHILAEQVNTNFHLNSQIYERSISDMGNKFQYIQEKMHLDSAKIDFALQLQQNARQRIENKIQNMGAALAQANRASVVVTQQMFNLKGPLVSLLSSLSQGVSTTTLSSLQPIQLIKRLQTEIRQLKQSREESRITQNQLMNNISDLMASKGLGTFRRSGWKRLLLGKMNEYQSVIADLEIIVKNLTEQSRILSQQNSSSQTELKRKVKDLNLQNQKLKQVNEELAQTIEFVKNKSEKRRRQFSENDEYINQQSKTIERLKKQVQKLKSQVENEGSLKIHQTMKELADEKLGLQIEKRKSIEEKLRYTQKSLKQVQNSYNKLQDRMKAMQQKQRTISPKKRQYARTDSIQRISNQRETIQMMEKTSKQIRQYTRKLEGLQKINKQLKKQSAQQQQQAQRIQRRDWEVIQIWKDKSDLLEKQIQQLKKKSKQSPSQAYYKRVTELQDSIQEYKKRVSDLQRQLNLKDIETNDKINIYKQFMKENELKAQKLAQKSEQVIIQMERKKVEVALILQKVQDQSEKYQQLLQKNQILSKEKSSVLQKLSMMQAGENEILKMRQGFLAKISKLEQKIKDFQRQQISWLEQKKNHQKFENQMSDIVIILESQYYNAQDQKGKLIQLLHFWQKNLKEGRLKEKLAKIIIQQNQKTVQKIQGEILKINEAKNQLNQSKKKLQQVEGLVSSIQQLKQITNKDIMEQPERRNKDRILKVRSSVIQDLIGQVKLNANLRSNYDKIAMKFRSQLQHSAFALKTHFQKFQKKVTHTDAERLDLNNKLQKYQEDVRQFEAAMNEIQTKKAQFQEFSNQYRQFEKRITQFDRNWVDEVINEHKFMNLKHAQISEKYGKAGISNVNEQLFQFAVKTIHKTIKWLLKLLRAIIDITNSWKSLRSNNKEFNDFLPSLLKVFSFLQEMIQKFLISLVDPTKIFDHEDDKGEMKRIWNIFKAEVAKSYTGTQNFSPKLKQFYETLVKDVQTINIEDYLNELQIQQRSKFKVPSVTQRRKIRKLIMRNRVVQVQIPEQQSGLRELTVTTQQIQKIKGEIKKHHKKMQQQRMQQQKAAVIDQYMGQAKKDAKKALDGAGIKNKKK